MEVIDGECAPFDVIDSDNRSAEFLVDKPPEWSNEEEVRLLRAHGSGPMQASSSSSHQGVLGAPHLMSLWRREPLIWIGPRCFQSLCGDQPLAARQGSESAAEFQKVLDHPELVVNEPIGALAHLGLARAYAMQGDPTIRISSRFGRTPTRTFPFLSRRRRSMRSFNSPERS